MEDASRALNRVVEMEPSWKETSAVGFVEGGTTCFSPEISPGGSFFVVGRKVSLARSKNLKSKQKKTPGEHEQLVRRSRRSRGAAPARTEHSPAAVRSDTIPCCLERPPHLPSHDRSLFHNGQPKCADMQSP